MVEFDENLIGVRVHQRIAVNRTGLDNEERKRSLSFRDCMVLLAFGTSGTLGPKLSCALVLPPVVLIFEIPL